MILSVFLADMGNKSLTVDLPIMCKTDKIVETTILLDTGAGGMFMHQEYAKKHGIILHKLLFPITPQNINRKSNWKDNTFHLDSNRNQWTKTSRKITHQQHRILRYHLWITLVQRKQPVYQLEHGENSNPHKWNEGV